MENLFNLKLSELLGLVDQLRDANERLTAQLNEYERIFGTLDKPVEQVTEADNLPTIEDLNEYQAVVLCQSLTDSQKYWYYEQQQQEMNALNDYSGL